MPRGIRGGARPRVLVVDDNLVNVEFLVDLLRLTGFEVRGCHQVDEALAAFSQTPFDLVITDLVMPERDGFDLIRGIRAGATAQATPIIVASASAFPGDQVRAIATGANDFVAKPVDAQLLLRKMAALLKVDYLYDERHDDPLRGDAPPSPRGADTPAGAAAPALTTPAACAVLATLREAAELGQMRRVQAMVDRTEDPVLRAALADLLATALREQDPDLVLQALDQVPAQS